MNRSRWNELKGGKRFFSLTLLIIFILCLYGLELKPENFLPQEYGWKWAADFFAEAFSPAADYHSPVDPSTPPYYQKILEAVWLTLKYATCSISLAIVLGIFFGFVASRSWWNTSKVSTFSFLSTRVLHRIAKTTITLGRSTHELLLAILFVAAFGRSSFAIILAIAIPYGCTLAKVFSEMLDEQPDNTKKFLLSQGGSPFSSWLFGNIPHALPDLLSYTFYRYECAIRSSIIVGFVGVETIGSYLIASHQSGAYDEVWTLLYTMLLLIIFFERWSHYIRRKLTTARILQKSSNQLSLQELKKTKPKSIGIQISWVAVLLLVAISWLTDFDIHSRLNWEQRMDNLERFIKSAIPYPVQKSGDWSDSLTWASDLFKEKGWNAILQTCYMATAAITIAFFASLIALPYSSKILNARNSFESFSGKKGVYPLFRKLIAYGSRGLFILTRAFPEFILAFLMLQIFGPTTWPLVLALAIHNYGILGRLGSELIDHSKLDHTKALIAHGARTQQLYLFSMLPAYFNRMLLYFFYRWETCIRDATMVGVVLSGASIGSFIDDAKANLYYDELVYFMLLGAAIVMVGDILSDIVRSRLKKDTA